MRMPAAPQVAIPQLKSQSLTRPAKPTAKKAKVAAGGTALLGLVTLLCLPGSSNLPARLDSHVSGRTPPEHLLLNVFEEQVLLSESETTAKRTSPV